MSSELCADFDQTHQSLYMCEGKEVTFVAKKAVFAEQHPLSGSLYPNKTHHTYVKIDADPKKDQWGQIVLVSDAAIDCLGRFRIQGRVQVKTLNRQRLEKKPGKSSYKRAWITVTAFTCIES